MLVAFLKIFSKISNYHSYFIYFLAYDRNDKVFFYAIYAFFSNEVDRYLLILSYNNLLASSSYE